MGVHLQHKLLAISLMWIHPQISFKSLIVTEFSYLFICLFIYLFIYVFTPKGQFKHELREKQNKSMHTKNTKKESCII
jgi:hypothetical protein